MPTTKKTRGAKDAGRTRTGATGTPSASTPAVYSRLLAAGQKKYGRKVFNTFDSSAGCEIRARYSTGVAVVNIALTGNAKEGFPGGRISEIFGDEHCGKTTLCLNTLAAVQAAGGLALFTDSESTTTRKRMHTLGVDTSKLLYSELEYIEDVLNMMVDMSKGCKRTNGVMLLDSVAGCMTRHEAGRDVGEHTIGRHALALSQGLRKLSQVLKKTPMAVLFVNQRKEGGIGVQFATERQRDATLGGKAIKFHSQVRLRLLYVKKINERVTDGGKPVYVGDLIKASVIKDKERGSNTRSCEVLLLLRKVGSQRGQFDNAMSCWYTGRLWEAEGTRNAGAIKLNGKLYKPDQWRKRYNTDKAFAASVHAWLKNAAQSLNEHGTAKRSKKAAADIDPDEQEEEEL